MVATVLRELARLSGFPSSMEQATSPLSPGDFLTGNPHALSRLT